ncbi:ankyrin repeat domain-containing protein [Fibrella arboris]|uniref:ankyrin repeat domain-containing protein n=1 Tax=Fibrella arboris TaxID=3242486 RepID=UPI00351FEE85
MSKIEDIFQAVRLNAWKEFVDLIKEVDINIKNEFGQNLLHEAISFQASQIANQLISLSIDVNNQDEQGQTPLHYAAAHNNSELTDALLKAGANVNLRDKHGNTVLWTAVFNARGKYDIVRLLILHGANKSTKNKANRSPYDFAVQIGDQTLLSLLSE